MSVAFNGVVLVAPGVASYIDDSASSSAPIASANSIAILGESERGETGQPVLFSDPATVRAYYGAASVDLPLVYGIIRAMTAGASNVYGVRVGNAIQASLAISSGSNNPAVSVRTKEWGYTGNAWSLTVSSNSTNVRNKNIVLRLHDGRTYSATNIGRNVLQIEYYPASRNCGNGTVGRVSGSASTSDDYALTVAPVGFRNAYISVAATDGVQIGSRISATNGAGKLGAGGVYEVTAIVSPTSGVNGRIIFKGTGGTEPEAGSVTAVIVYPLASYQPTAEVVSINNITYLKLTEPVSGGPSTVTSIPLTPYDTLAKLVTRGNQLYRTGDSSASSTPLVAASTLGAPSSTTFETMGLTSSGNAVFRLGDANAGNLINVSVPYVPTSTLSSFASDVQANLRLQGTVGSDSIAAATATYYGPVSGTGLRVGTTGATLQNSSVSVATGGAGYKIGDVVEVNNGTASGTGFTVALTGTGDSLGGSGLTVGLAEAGTGYKVGDIVSVATGSDGQLRIATVNAGAVATFTIIAAGGSYVTGTVATATVANGTGGQLRITAVDSSSTGVVTAVEVIVNGSGYSAVNSSQAVIVVLPVFRFNAGSAAQFVSISTISGVLDKIGLPTVVAASPSITGTTFQTPQISFSPALPSVSANGWRLSLAPGMADGTLSSSKIDLLPVASVITSIQLAQDTTGLLAKTVLSANTDAMIESLNGPIMGSLVQANKVFSASRLDNGTYSFTGATEDYVTPSHWDTALSSLQQLENVEIIVPMTPSSSIQASVLAHCQSMSGPLGKRERFAVMGGDRGLGVTAVKALASKFNDKRAVLVWPGFKDYDDNGDLLTWAPYFLAPTIAGQLSSQADVATPLTTKTVAVRGLETVAKISEVDDLVSNGIFAIRYDSGRGYTVAQSLTTWTGDTKFVRREISTMRATDAVMRAVRSSISSLIGGKISTQLTADIKSRVTSSLEDAEAKGLILSGQDKPAFKDVIVRAVGDALYVDFAISPAIPANYILITAHIL